MKLFLASEVKHPDSFKKLTDFVGGFENKTISYIPTAANAEGWGSWKSGGSWNLVQTLNANVKLIQLEEFHEESAVNEIMGSDVVWFAGGMPGYLMYWIRRCHLDIKLKDILENGTVYVGSSAGSMVVGQSLDIAAWDFVDQERGAENITPVKIVDFDIFPHYDESLLPKIKENYKGKKLYMLKNGEEIIIDNGKITVEGQERLIIND